MYICCAWYTTLICLCVFAPAGDELLLCYDITSYSDDADATYPTNTRLICCLVNILCILYVCISQISPTCQRVWIILHRKYKCGGRQKSIKHICVLCMYIVFIYWEEKPLNCSFVVVLYLYSKYMFRCALEEIVKIWRERARMSKQQKLYV